MLLRTCAGIRRPPLDVEYKLDPTDGSLSSEQSTVVEFAPVCVFEILADLAPEAMSIKTLELRMSEVTELSQIIDDPSTANAIRSVRLLRLAHAHCSQIVPIPQPTRYAASPSPHSGRCAAS